MTRISIVLAALVVILPAIAFAQEEGAVKPGGMATATIDVRTAKCEMCADAITEAARKVKGVQSAVVDLDKKVATVEYDASIASVARIEKAISAAGYDANKVRRDRKAYDRLCSCCK